jgi:hypothetical protein
MRTRMRRAIRRARIKNCNYEYYKENRKNAIMTPNFPPILETMLQSAERSIPVVIDEMALLSFLEKFSNTTLGSL